MRYCAFFRRYHHKKKMVHETVNRFPINWKHHFRLIPMRETQLMRLNKKLLRLNRSILLKADSLVWPPRLNKNGSMWTLHYYCRVSNKNQFYSNLIHLEIIFL